MSTQHDRDRLARGQASLATGKALQDMTDLELAQAEESNGAALAGIQSTDDPSPEYAETERKLLKRYQAIQEEKKRRAAS